jgi:long-subunit fatty acid transport protein
VTDVAIGFASNSNDKLYIGGSLGIPIVNYQKQATFTETDATGNNNNNFNYSQLVETYTTKGVGVNLKVGVIYKPSDDIRLGLAIHSPTVYGLQDTYEATMTTNTENYPPSPGSVTVSSNTFTNGTPALYKYDLTNPWRAMISGSYVFSSVENVTQQKGFVTADLEYVNYKSNHYRTAEDDNDNTYYDGVNKSIKDYYKGAVNFRVGGELKFTTVMARLGFSYYGNPYKDSDLKGRKMFASGGVGYRNKGHFIDLTYVLALNKDVNFPYRLSDKANTFATLNQTGGNIALSVGFKF